MKRFILILIAAFAMANTGFALNDNEPKLPTREEVQRMQEKAKAMLQEKAKAMQQQKLTPQEFREKQQAFITKAAELTTDEADKFFPLYFELQEKKKELNDKVWNLMKEGRKDGVSEERYDKIVDEIYDTRISIDKLDKSYVSKYKKFLSGKKIYLVQEAEMKFRRDMLKNMGQKPPQPRQKKETDKK